MIEFIKRWPWTVAFLILFIAMSVGFFRVESIQNDVEKQREDRIVESQKRDKQFCTAIPNLTEAGPQALVNILLADLHRRNASEEEIDNLLEHGRRYTREARRLAILELPECPKILGE